MSDQEIIAEEGLLHLSNKTETRNFQVVGQVTDTQLGLFERKIITGDSTKDSDMYMSSFIISDLTGGGQIRDLNEGSDLTRFWWAVMDTCVVAHITLPPKVRKLRPTGVGVTTVRPIGDVGTRTYIAFGTDAYGFDAATKAFLPLANALTKTPVGKGREFLNRLYVPCGVDGFFYAVEADGDTGDLTVTPGQDGLTPVDFALVGREFWAICTDGALWSTTDGATWTRPILPGTVATYVVIPNGVPRKAFSYWDKAGIERLHIITSRDVWIYNKQLGDVERTALKWPPHPRFALGAEVWRSSEDLHISAGDDIVKFQGSTNVVPGSGLRRDAGLPATNRGYIVDLQGEMSALFALVQGTTTDNLSVSGLTSDDVTDWDAGELFDVTAAVSSLMLTRGSGWHCYWEGDDPSQVMTWMVLGAVNDANYALWWGSNDGYAYRLTQYPDFHNPLIAIESQVGEFASSGYLYSGKFDAQMLGFDKIASHAFIHWEYLPAGCHIKVAYRTDRHEWYDLGEAVDDGNLGEGELAHHATVLMFDDDGTFSWGERFNWIEFRIKLERDSGLAAWLTPMWRALSFHYTKRPQNATSLGVVLQFEDMLNGMGASESYEWLKAQMEGETMLKLNIGRKEFRTRIAGIEKMGFTGMDETGQVKVNFIDLRPLSI